MSLLAAPGEVDGRRMSRASAAPAQAGGGSCRGATVATVPDSTPPTLRGRRGRERRIADRVAADFAARHAPPTDDETVDFDVAAVDAEVEDASREERPARSLDGPRRNRVVTSRARSSTAGPVGCRHLAETARSDHPGAARLAGRYRPGRPPRRRRGRATRRQVVPLRHSPSMSALVWIARDADRRPRPRSLRARRSGAGRCAGSADGAGLRAQRARRRRDRRPGRGPLRLAARPSTRPRRERPGLAPAHDRAGRLPDEPRELRVGGRLHQDALLRDLFHSATRR